MSIKKTILLAMMLMTLICSASSLSVYLTARSQKDDGLAINLSGRQRMLSQRMTKEALMLMRRYSIAGEVDASLVGNLALTRDVFEITLKALTYSGQAPLKPARNAPTRFVPSAEEPVLTQLKKVEALWKDFREQIDRILESQDEEALEYVLQNNIPLLMEMDKAVGMFQEHSEDSTANLISMQLAGLGVFLLILGAVIWFLSRKIIGPIHHLASCSRELARGNLALGDGRLSELETIAQRRDELGNIGSVYMELFTYLRNCADVAEEIADCNLNVRVTTASSEDVMGRSFQTMINQLNTFFNEVNDASMQVDAGAAMIAESSHMMSSNVTEQASSMQEISSSVTEISSQIRSNADNAGKANQLAKDSRDAADAGFREMEAMVQAMKEIHASSQSISNIIKTIDGIAFQTNLLALNAAVESARAGKYGKGFAVVAEEVRNLSARSSKAARETSELIQESVDKVEHGNRITQQTLDALGAIVSRVGQVADLLEDIARASAEQSGNVDQVNQGLRQLDSVVQENTASIQEAAAASQELSRMATQLKDFIARYELLDKESLAKRLEALPE